MLSTNFGLRLELHIGKEHVLCRGMAPDAKLAFNDLAGSNADKIYTPQDLSSDYFNYAYDVGARVHSDSWGSSSTSYDYLAAQVDLFTWQQPVRLHFCFCPLSILDYQLENPSQTLFLSYCKSKISIPSQCWNVLKLQLKIPATQARRYNVEHQRFFERSNCKCNFMATKGVGCRVSDK